jgi:peptidoglycan/xylan/chitin deacetylase (PgdA/CDA1 family)
MNSWKRVAFTSVVGRMAPALIGLGRAGSLRILNYHRINHAQPDSVLDNDVISASPELFDQQMRFCKRHFDVISFTELEAALDGGAPLPRRPLIISFDDGYEDNYRLAFPILRDHGLSATFCICVDPIGTDRLFWWDQVAYCVYTHQDTHLSVAVAGKTLVFALPTRAAREAALNTLLRALKEASNAQRLQAVTRLAALAVPRTERSVGRQSMTWDEVRALVAGGMTIASHSMTHPVLARVEGDGELRYEVEQSKAILEREIGAPVRVFSYPVGGATAFNARVQAAVKAAGYRFALSYLGGFNTIGPHLDWYGMRRLHVDGLNAREFRTQLAWAI